MRKLLRRGVVCVACSLAWCVPAAAQEILWQTPIYAEVASAADFGGQVLSRSDDGRTRLIVATAWQGVSADGSETGRARVIAYDPVSGERLWQRDLDADCTGATFGSTNALAIFANGDIAVVASQPPKPGFQQPEAACYARLDAGNGHIVWSAADAPQSSGTAWLWNTAIAVDVRDDVIATGRHGQDVRTIRLSGADGSQRWQSERTRPSWLLNARAIETGASDLVLVLSNEYKDFEREGRIDALDVHTGALRWQFSTCESFGRAPRLQSDDSVAFVSQCADKATIGRLAGSDGHVLWQRDIPATVSDYQFDDSGNIVLIGTLSVDGVAVEAARFAASDGRTLWATPGALGHIATNSQDTSIGLKTAVGDEHLLVWEIIGPAAMQLVMQTGRLSRYDLATGRLLQRQDFTAADRDYLYKGNASLLSLPNGDALLGDLTSYRQIWLGRMNTSLEVAWYAREQVAAPQVLWMHPDTGSSPPLLLATEIGAPGLIAGGRAVTDPEGPSSRDGIPYLAKLAQSDGRSLWRWQPSSPVQSRSPRVDSIAADADGALYAIGSAVDADYEDSPFVARIDASNGRTLWERFGDRQLQEFDQPRALAIGAAGEVFVGSAQIVRRYAAADGAPLWTTALPDADGTADDAQLAVDAAGDVVAAVSYRVGDEDGIQFVKLRGDDGRQIWMRRVVVTSPTFAIGHLALLPQGDVVGLSDELGLLRLSGTDGGVRWQQTTLSARNVIVDRGGNLVLIDVPTNDNGRHGMARIDASNGQALWSLRIPVSATHSDDEDSRGTVVAFDQDGGLLIAHPDEGTDYLLAKLALGDGTLSWRKSVALSSRSDPEGLVRGRDGKLFLAVNKAARTTATATVLGIAPPGGSTPLPTRRHSARPLPDPLWQLPPRSPTLPR